MSSRGSFTSKKFKKEISDEPKDYTKKPIQFHKYIPKNNNENYNEINNAKTKKSLISNNNNDGNDEYLNFGIIPGIDKNKNDVIDAYIDSANEIEIESKNYKNDENNYY